MKLLALKEISPNENRVSLTPELVSKYQKLGVEVFVESKAGEKSSISDADFEKAGAKIISDISQILPEIDVIISVQNIEIDFSKTKAGVVLIALLNPHFQKEKIVSLAQKNISAFALEFLPRITRAQSMDTLSSQSNLAGYRAVIDAVYEMQKAVPMMMTAAGTISAAKFMILGAGVAGLQAIATARRLGAVVSAYDVRPSSADEVKSMGATFIDLELEALEGAGGYAREMTPERAAKQRELLTPYIAKSHVVITTAAVPGRKAPQLMTQAMVDAMGPGTIIVDLAAETGGNVEGSKPGEVVVTKNGVRIWGGKDVPSQLPFHASSLYSRNVVNLLTLLTTPAKDGAPVALNLDFADEIINAAAVTHAGQRRDPSAGGAK